MGPGAVVFTILLVVAFLALAVTMNRKTSLAEANKSEGGADAASSNDGASDEEKKVYGESEKEYRLFEDVVGEDEGLDEIQILRYEYEQYICLDDGAIDQVTGNGGKDIGFEPEPENEYDPNAIAIHLRGSKIGYVYKKGNMQSMIHDWIKKDWYYRGYINKVFVDDNKATYKVGFYTPLSRYESKEFSLTKTRTKSWNDVPRSENLDCCDINEVVSIEYDSNNDTYCVCDGAYNEVGELGSGARRFIEDSDCEKCIGVLSDIDYDNARAKIIIYLID